jgi:hypothetical protein
MISLLPKPPAHPTEAWDVWDTRFPHDGTPAEKLRFALRYAILAPSSRNTQPWRFRVLGDSVALYLDAARALHVADPDERELMVSCGAALEHLYLALRHFGYEAIVKVFPTLSSPDLLARVTLGAARVPTREEDELFHAISVRRTFRKRFEPIVVPAEVLRDLRHEAALAGVRLHLVTDGETRAQVANLVGRADRVQYADKRFRRELAAWVHPNRSDRRDGIPGYAQGLNDTFSRAEPLTLRAFDIGAGQAAKDRDLVASAPLVVVLGTTSDTLREQLAAGRALARVLLRACASGIYASFLMQPIEVADLRPFLRETIGMEGFPLVMLRMGYGSQIQPTPRRALEDVLMP